MNKPTEKINHVVDKINEATDKITNAVDKITDAADKIAHSTDKINKPTTKINDVADKINEATNKIVNAADNINKPNDQMCDVANKMGVATGKMGVATGKMNQATEKMTGVTDKISEIDHMAHYDYLTKIPNHLNFKEALIQTVANAKRHNRLTCVLFLDLDHFKTINDTYGHESGDTLLKEISNRLQSVMRKEDMIARLGGDEFAISMKEIEKIEDAEILAKKLIHVFQNPFILVNKQVNITASIGIAIYPSTGKTASELMQNADKAMYQAKKSGKNNFQFYKQK